MENLGGSWLYEIIAYLSPDYVPVLECVSIKMGETLSSDPQNFYSML